MTDAAIVTDAAQDPNFIPAFILRNQGVPISLYRLDEAGQRIMTGEDADATAVTRTMHLRFDSNAVAAIEEMFDGLRAFVPIVERVPLTNPDGSVRTGPDGKPLETEVQRGEEERTFYGLEAFQKAMEIRTMSTVRKVMAAAFGISPDEMGRQMIDGLGIEYQNAVGVAWSIAQGVDPTEAAKVFNRATAALAAAKKDLASELERTMDEALGETTDSPGNPG